MKRVAVVLAAVAATAPVAASCSDSDDGGDAPAATVPDTSVAATTTAASPSTSAAATTIVVDDVVGDELVGRWAHYDVVAYEDDTLKTLIISYGFNDFAEVDGRIVDQASFCFSEQRTDQPIETSLSDAATQAIQPPPAPLAVEEVDGTLTIRRDATPTPVGIELENPFDEPLPTDPDDPRIVDDDGDGNPGITVDIVVSPELRGELYIARREIFAYDAALSAPDLIEGTVTDDSEQLVIGASDPIFATSPANWRQHPDPAKSPMILVRVDDTWDCDRLRVERDDLFPPTPDVDW